MNPPPPNLEAGSYDQGWNDCLETCIDLLILNHHTKAQAIEILKAVHDTPPPPEAA